MQSLLATTLATDASRRGPRGTLNELRTRLGVRTVDPLAHLTLQQRRLAFIERERPLAWAMLVGIWPMHQAKNPDTGNMVTRARFLDWISRALSGERDLPDKEDLGIFGAEHMLEEFLDSELEGFSYRLPEGASLSDVEDGVRDAYERSTRWARNDALGLDSDGWAQDLEFGREEWWWHHLSEHEPDDVPYRGSLLDEDRAELEWTTSGPRFTYEMDLENVPGAYDPVLVFESRIELSERPRHYGGKRELDWFHSLRIEDPGNTLPPALKRWIEAVHVGDEDQLEQVSFEIDGQDFVDEWAILPCSSRQDECPFVQEDDYDWLFGDPDRPEGQLPLFRDLVVSEIHVAERLQAAVESRGFWDQLQLGLAFIAKLHDEDLTPRVEWTKAGIGQAIDWRTAHPEEDLGSYGLMSVLYRSFQSHQEDAIRNSIAEIAAELGLVSDDEDLVERADRQTIDQAIFDDGARIVELLGDYALRLEGLTMKHCIGDEENDHPQMLREGTVRVFSYRRPDGTPRATWETFTRDLATSGLQGPHNGPVYDEDGRRRLTWFQWTVRNADNTSERVDPDFGPKDEGKLELRRMDVARTVEEVQDELRWSNAPGYERYEPEGLEDDLEGSEE